jgi:hypothetical protein
LFEEFFSIGREYGVFFNQNEFYSLWKRSKSKIEKPEEVGDAVVLCFDQFLALLLVNNFKTKARYGLDRDIPIEKSMQKPQPSYKVSHWK